MAVAFRGTLLLAIQEKSEQVRNLVNLGKERGYLLHDEVIELLPIEEQATEESSCLA